MKLPFTVEQFYGVFHAYNEAVWPAQLVLLGLALAALVIEQIQPDLLADAGRIAPGTALRLLAMARHDASPRLVPRPIRLGLD